MENIQKTRMNLVLSTDAKPRLKWTSELHQRFVEAVHQLGGPDKATPKGLMRVMSVPGLTLYHLKSHLQKYRLGKSRMDAVSDAEEQDDDQSNNGADDVQVSLSAGEKQYPIDENKQIAETLQMQMEVQRKFQEQIEVQRHLQVRIEAQGKYLQSVLKKAEETLANYTSSSLDLEFARSELSRLASMVTKGYPSASFSGLTEAEEEGGGCLTPKKPENAGTKKRRCSVESSLTSSESSETKLENCESMTRRCIELPLMEVKPEAMNMKRKRRQNDAVCVEQPKGKIAFGAEEDDDLRLSLSSYKTDMETCPNIRLGLQRKL